MTYFAERSLTVRSRCSHSARVFRRTRVRWHMDCGLERDLPFVRSLQAREPQLVLLHLVNSSLGRQLRETFFLLPSNVSVSLKEMYKYVGSFGSYISCLCCLLNYESLDCQLFESSLPLTQFCHAAAWSNRRTAEKVVIFMAV